ncbi:hypothetical protein [Amnibacterium endophyticum]|uniref:Alpha/beta hydrolase n=1 Tax=Amnibacterium endophyticum TaxID=2109337 RepID=A0ABW4LCM2_9MICO
MSAPPSVGGPVAVDTGEMLRAAAVLGGARKGLRGLAARARAAALGASPHVSGALHEAADRLDDAERQAALAADGLRTAAQRYGWTEHAIARSQQTGFALAGAIEGLGLRIAPAPTLLADALVSGGFLAQQALDEWIRTGRIAPQSDPEVVRWLQLRLSSLDDTVRGLLGVETPRDLLVDDPGSPFGTEAIGALLAAMIWPTAHPIAVRRTASSPTARPGSLEELGRRLPDGASPEGQVRVERYEDGGRARWIVYSAGTVTFDVRSGEEPFDLESDVRGVAGTPTDAQRAVLDAMRQAGVGPDDPVLLVGHSQGALNVLRIAERGDYAVEGVVQFGGPTEQIPAPPGVDVLQVTHDQDLVPALGGVPAAAGAGTVVVRRSLPDAALRPVYGSGAAAAFPAHDMVEYRRTVAAAEASGSTRIAALRTRWTGFLGGEEGTATRYAARRIVPDGGEPVSAPGRPRSAGAAPAPPASR